MVLKSLKSIHMYESTDKNISKLQKQLNTERLHYTSMRAPAKG